MNKCDFTFLRMHSGSSMNEKQHEKTEWAGVETLCLNCMEKDPRTTSIHFNEYNCNCDFSR